MDRDNVKRFEQGSPMRLVSKLNRLNQSSLAGPLAEIGIARGSLPIIMEVLCNEGIIQDDISKSLSLDRAATARTLRHLEENGFVRRTEDPDDRRCKRVHTTGMARDLRGAIVSVLQDQREIFFSGFDERERAQFLHMLERVIENMLAAQAS